MVAVPGKVGVVKLLHPGLVLAFALQTTLRLALGLLMCKSISFAARVSHPANLLCWEDYGGHHARSEVPNVRTIPAVPVLR